jgi:hypothetical protein
MKWARHAVSNLRLMRLKPGGDSLLAYDPSLRELGNSPAYANSVSDLSQLFMIKLDRVTSKDGPYQLAI